MTAHQKRFKPVEDAHGRTGSRSIVAAMPRSPMGDAHFDSLDVPAWSRALNRVEPVDLERIGRQMAMRVAKHAVHRVPAYGTLLRSAGHGAGSSSMRLDSLPILDKTNYLNHFPIEELCPNGRLVDLRTVAVSSGSTGEPFLWPRDLPLEDEYASLLELMLTQCLGIGRKKPTLVVLSFALGIYIAGIITLKALWRVQRHVPNLFVTTPGLDRNAALRCMTTLAPHFQRVLVIAYPPFLKAIMEETSTREVGDGYPEVRFLAAGESFTESFRDYLLARMGSTAPLTTGANIYGSADAAVLGHETPTSILIRRWATTDKDLSRDLFGSEAIPSVEAFHPYFKHFEEVDGRLVFSTFGGIPLVRYAIGDLGGVIRYDRLDEICTAHGFDISSALRDSGCGDLAWRLPLVYLFGRDDKSIPYYGLKVHPGPVRDLLAEPEWLPLVSGRFVLAVESDETYNQRLLVRIELAPNQTLTEEEHRHLTSSLDEQLRAHNVEYRELRKSLEEVLPAKAMVYRHEDPEYFPVGRIKNVPVSR